MLKVLFTCQSCGEPAMLTDFELQSHVSTSCQTCQCFISPAEVMIGILGRFEPADISVISQAAKNLFEDTLAAELRDDDPGGVFL